MVRVSITVQPRKQKLGMDVMLVGNVTFFRAEQPSKHEEGIEESADGRTTISRDVQSTKVPSVVTQSGIVMCVSFEHPEKTPTVEVTPVKNCISSKLVTVFQSVKRPSKLVAAAASA